MGRYPRTARGSTLKCISCNAPVVETVDGAYACVECGSSPIRRNAERENGVSEYND
jgi:hypothetical protein